MSRTLFGVVAFGATLLGAPALANAGFRLVADLNLSNDLPDLSYWALFGLGILSIGFAGSRRKEARIGD